MCFPILLHGWIDGSWCGGYVSLLQPLGGSSLSPAMATCSGTLLPLFLLPKPGSLGTLASQRLEDGAVGAGRSRGLVRKTW